MTTKKNKPRTKSPLNPPRKRARKVQAEDELIKLPPPKDHAGQTWWYGKQEFISNGEVWTPIPFIGGAKQPTDTPAREDGNASHEYFLLATDIARDALTEQEKKVEKSREEREMVWGSPEQKTNQDIMANYVVGRNETVEETKLMLRGEINEYLRSFFIIREDGRQPQFHMRYYTHTDPTTQVRVYRTINIVVTEQCIERMREALK